MMYEEPAFKTSTATQKLFKRKAPDETQIRSVVINLTNNANEVQATSTPVNLGSTDTSDNQWSPFSLSPITVASSSVFKKPFKKIKSTSCKRSSSSSSDRTASVNSRRRHNSFNFHHQLVTEQLRALRGSYSDACDKGVRQNITKKTPHNKDKCIERLKCNKEAILSATNANIKKNTPITTQNEEIKNMQQFENQFQERYKQQLDEGSYLASDNLKKSKTLQNFDCDGELFSSSQSKFKIKMQRNLKKSNLNGFFSNTDSINSIISINKNEEIKSNSKKQIFEFKSGVKTQSLGNSNKTRDVNQLPNKILEFAPFEEQVSSPEFNSLSENKFHKKDELHSQSKKCFVNEHESCRLKEIQNVESERNKKEMPQSNSSYSEQIKSNYKTINNLEMNKSLQEKEVFKKFDRSKNVSVSNEKTDKKNTPWEENDVTRQTNYDEHINTENKTSDKQFEACNQYNSRNKLIKLKETAALCETKRKNKDSRHVKYSNNGSDNKRNNTAPILFEHYKEEQQKRKKRPPSSMPSVSARNKSKQKRGCDNQSSSLLERSVEKVVNINCDLLGSYRELETENIITKQHTSSKYKLSDQITLPNKQESLKYVNGGEEIPLEDGEEIPLEDLTKNKKTEEISENVDFYSSYEKFSDGLIEKDILEQTESSNNNTLYTIFNKETSATDWINHTPPLDLNPPEDSCTITYCLNNFNLRGRFDSYGMLTYLPTHKGPPQVLKKISISFTVFKGEGLVKAYGKEEYIREGSNFFISSGTEYTIINTKMQPLTLFFTRFSN